MSAPIVVIAVAGAAPLLFKSSTSIALLIVVPVGMWAKASISPLSERARESGGSAAGRQSRSSTYPQAFLVNLTRCAIAEALVLALDVVKVQPGADTGLGGGHALSLCRHRQRSIEIAAEPEPVRIGLSRQLTRRPDGEVRSLWQP